MVYNHNRQKHQGKDVYQYGNAVRVEGTFAAALRR